MKQFEYSTDEHCADGCMVELSMHLLSAIMKLFEDIDGRHDGPCDTLLICYVRPHALFGYWLLLGDLMHFSATGCYWETFHLFCRSISFYLTKLVRKKCRKENWKAWSNVA